MTSGLADETAPILVLGVGNVLLGDDGFGPELLEELAEWYEGEPSIEFIDGGTQGLALLGRVANRSAVVVLDAMRSGKTPGTISVLERRDLFAIRGNRASTAHEGNAYELLATSAMLGDLPQRVYVVGVEPEAIQTGIGLSEVVQRSLDLALEKAVDILDTLLAKVEEPVNS